MRVEYIDHMGTDLSVVNAARVSFRKKSKPDGFTLIHGYGDGLGVQIPNLSKADQGLVQFLARGCTSRDWDKTLYALQAEMVYGEDLSTAREMVNHIRRMPPHWSPFAHTSISLHLKMPIFVARQIMKHTTGMVYSEVSRRYVTDEPEFYVPDVWRKAADNVKQGSSDEPAEYDHNAFHTPWETQALDQYNWMLQSGVAPEQARMILPQSMYTEVFATGNLYAWTTMFVQRTDSHTQKETRDLAHQIGEIIKPLYPVSWEALTQ